MLSDITLDFKYDFLLPFSVKTNNRLKRHNRYSKISIDKIRKKQLFNFMPVQCFIFNFLEHKSHKVGKQAGLAGLSYNQDKLIQAVQSGSQYTCLIKAYCGSINNRRNHPWPI